MRQCWTKPLILVMDHAMPFLLVRLLGALQPKTISVDEGSCNGEWACWNTGANSVSVGIGGNSCNSDLNSEFNCFKCECDNQDMVYPTNSLSCGDAECTTPVP